MKKNVLAILSGNIIIGFKLSISKDCLSCAETNNNNNKKLFTVV